MDKYGYIGIETLLNFCENSKDHSVTPNDFMRMKRVRMQECEKGKWIPQNYKNDLISRKQAIDAADKIIERDTSGSNAVVNAMIAWSEYIRTLPSAEPAQQWIPCSETVDIPDHEIMACDRYGAFIIGYLYCKDEQWICESDDSIMHDPVAWCELPKPYKEGGIDER